VDPRVHCKQGRVEGDCHSDYGQALPDRHLVLQTEEHDHDGDELTYDPERPDENKCLEPDARASSAAEGALQLKRKQGIACGGRKGFG
jgi:hypothetical protein